MQEVAASLSQALTVIGSKHDNGGCVRCDRVYVRDEFSDPVVGVRDLFRVARFVNDWMTNTIKLLVRGDAVPTKHVFEYRQRLLVGSEFRLEPSLVLGWWSIGAVRILIVDP
jgi:hypothetical protein